MPSFTKMTPLHSRPHLLLLLLLFLFSTVPSQVTSAKCHPDDKRALLAVKKFWNDPGNLFSTWTPATGCCSWIGVSCGVDSAGDRVTSLAIFAYANLSGTIAPSIGDLTHLTHLYLRKLPNLVGPIIPELTKLAGSLTFLDLDWNSLSGPVPSFLARLTKLTYLNLAFNRFTGTIPPELGEIPLSFLRLDRNRLTGTIPALFRANASTDTFYMLDLSHNDLSGPIPASLGRIKFLSIDLSRNRLTGDASFLLGRDKMRTMGINLSRNMLTFDLGKVEFAENLGLDLSHNMIYGEIPAQVAEAVPQKFNVSYNRLCGRIPTGDGMRGVDVWQLAHNKCLCGPPLPPCK